MELKIAFIGFGNVAREFGRILDQRRGLLAEGYATSVKTVGIATGRHGVLVNSAGIDLKEAIRKVENGDSLSQSTRIRSANEMIESIEADIIFETSPLSPHDGEPAATFIRNAIKRSIHIVTANKGPIACSYNELKALAKTYKVSFRFEGTVMDGAPVFNLYE